MNQTLRGLEEKRWVTRRPHPGHGRILQADLTRDGRAALRACHRAADAIEDQMVAGSRCAVRPVVSAVVGRGVYSSRRPARHFACVLLGGLVRRLVASATSRPKGGDMEHSHRQIGQRVQAAREQAIICHVYGKRG